VGLGVGFLFEAVRGHRYFLSQQQSTLEPEAIRGNSKAPGERFVIVGAAGFRYCRIGLTQRFSEHASVARW